MSLRSPRARIVGSLFTVLLVAMVSLMVYAMIPFRTHGARTPVTSSTGTRQALITATGRGGTAASRRRRAGSAALPSSARTANPSAGGSDITGPTPPGTSQAAGRTESQAGQPVGPAPTGSRRLVGAVGRWPAAAKDSRHSCTR